MSVPLLDIPLRSSRIYAGALVLLYGGTAVLLVMAPLNLWVRWLLLAIFAVCSWRALRRWRYLSSLLRLQIFPEGSRVITKHGEEECSGVIQALVTRPLVVLQLKSLGGGRRQLPLFADMASGEDLRRLRVWLRNGN